jgi:hypothetical protein
MTAAGFLPKWKVLFRLRDSSARVNGVAVRIEEILIHGSIPKEEFGRKERVDYRFFMIPIA